MSTRRMLVAGSGVCLALSVLSSCGSDDADKKERPAAEGGAAGQVGRGPESGASTAGGVDGAGASAAEAGAGAADAAGGAGLAGAGEVAGGAGSGGAGGEGGSAPSFEIGAYVSPTGDDTLGTGTLEQPVETLTRAAALVQPGQAIGLLDGVHIVDYFAQIPDGVAVVGVNPGGATIGQMANFNGGVTFLGDSTIDGLKIGYAVNLLRADAGTLRVTNTQFGAHPDGSGNDAAFSIGAGGRLVLEAPGPDAAWYYEPNGGRIAQLADGSSLSVSGGVFEGAVGGSVFLVYSGAVTASFTGVSFVDCAVQQVITLGNGGINVNASTLVLDDVLLEESGTSAGIYVGFGTPVVTIRDSIIDTQNGSGIYITADNYQQAQDQTVTIERSLITGNDVGITSYYYGQAVLTLTDTHVDANNVGVRFMYTDLTGSSLSMTGGSISDNTSYGFAASSETNKPNRLKLRGVTVSGNGEHGLELYGDAAASFDLGTVADPGNNVLQNPGAAAMSAALIVNTPALVTAVGNTWIPSQQGASAAGKYVPSAGDFTEVTGPVTAGQNYRIAAAGQKLRL